MAAVGQACAGHQADVSGAENADFYAMALMRSLPMARTLLTPRMSLLLTLRSFGMVVFFRPPLPLWERAGVRGILFECLNDFIQDTAQVLEDLIVLKTNYSITFTV